MRCSPQGRMVLQIGWIFQMYENISEMKFIQLCCKLVWCVFDKNLCLVPHLKLKRSYPASTAYFVLTEAVRMPTRFQPT